MNPPAPWAEIRSRYEVNGEGCYKLAKAFGLNPKTVTAHAKREGWLPRGALGAEAGRLAVVKFIQRQSEAVAQGLARHMEFADNILEVSLREARKLKERQDQGIGIDFQDLKRLADTGAVAVQLQRLTAGLPDTYTAEAPEDQISEIKFTFDEAGVGSLEKHTQRRLQLVRAREEAEGGDAA